MGLILFIGAIFLVIAALYYIKEGQDYRNGDNETRSYIREKRRRRRERASSHTNQYDSDGNLM